MEKIKEFNQLRIWQLGIEIVKDIYRITKGFPKEELYGLIAQMKRAAVSIPSNVAEGFERFHNKEFRQFLRIALGSAAELKTQSYIAKELEFINASELDNILNKLNSVSKMTVTLINKL